MLVVLVGAALYYRAWHRRAREDGYREIASISRMKAQQIERWRTERLSGVTVAAESPFLVRAVRTWRAHPDAEVDIKKDLSAWLTLQKDEYPYAQALLLDRRGRVLLSAQTMLGATAEETVQALDESASTREAVLSDLYAAGDRIFLDAVAPLGPGSGPDAVFVDVRTDARRSLFPIVQSWPTPSPSAEALLVRRDGDAALFLSDLRHRAGTALALRIPLSRLDVPAVRAVQGGRGMFEGTDYRGARTLADMRPIAGASWLLVCKIDSREVYTDADFRALLTFLVAALLVLLAGAGTAFGLRQRQARLYLSLLRAERQEREIEQEYRTAMYSIGDAVIGTDTAGLVWHMNPEAVRLTGFAEEEARGKPLADVFRIISEDSRMEVECPVDRVLREGGVVGLANHTLLVARDGSERPIADSGSPIRGEDGALRGVVLVFRDQSEEREAHRRLEASEERYRLLVENLGVGIASADPSDCLTFANPAAEQIFGVPSGSLAGRSLREFLSEGEYSRVRAETARRAQGQRSSYQITISRSDGQERRVQLTAVPQFDSQGRFAGTFGTVQDVTEMHKAETELRESEEHYRNTFTNAPFGVFHSTVKGRLVRANPAYARMMGYDSPQEMIEAVNRGSVAEVLYAEPERREALLGELLRSGGWQEFPNRYRRKDGRIISAILTFRLYPHPGADEAELEGFVEDVTDRERAEEERKKLQEQLLQAQKMEAVGRLAGGIAHDFNNILTAIYGYCELGLENAPRREGPPRTFFLQIRDSATRAASLTSQLLSFSRRRILQLRTVNLADLVADMIDMLTRLLGEDIDVHAHRPTQLWSVRADPGQIEQVILNLAVNSRDAMPDGGVLTIETANVSLDEGYVRVHPQLKAGDYVVLAVSDTGHGMDAATLDRIYEPFFTTKEVGKGTGLGLATVYGIVKQSGGSIYCYSEVGNGTTFKIYLPRAEAATENAAHAAPPLAAPGVPNATVLFVDDDEAVRTIAVAILRSAGYAVIAARDGKEALAALSSMSAPLDLLITDVVMPGMNGVEVARAAAQSFVRSRVLFISGYTEDAIVHHGILQEGIELLQKPFTATDLLQKVRTVLEAGRALPPGA